MNQYDQFAPFYDAVMGDRSDVIDIVRRTINEYGPGSTSMLDLGCGTGGIQAGLPEYVHTGVDLSSGMIDRAAQRIPQATWIQGDIRIIELNQSFDVITCLFDTIKHLTVELTIEPIGPARVEWHTTVQETQSDGVIQVYEDTAIETAFPINIVRSALLKQFNILETFTASGEPPSDTVGRVYFVCKPK